ncbi:MAG: hypothetical protein AAF335_01415 [Bacteroidota bacterium]
MCKSKRFFLLLAAVTLSSKTTYALLEENQKTEKSQDTHSQKKQTQSQSKNTLKIALFTVGIISVALVLGIVINSFGSSDLNDDENNLEASWKKSTKEIDGQEIDIYEFIVSDPNETKDPEENLKRLPQKKLLFKNSTKSLMATLKNKDRDYKYGICLGGQTCNIPNMYFFNNLPNKENLKSLEVWYPESFDILSSFTSLVELEIYTYEANIKSLDFIKPLKNLKTLSLQGFPVVKDIKPIKDKTNLEILKLIGFDDLEDLNPLESLKNTLKELKLFQLMKVKDFSPVGKLKKLSILSIYDIPKVKELSFLKNLKKLKELILSSLPKVNQKYHCKLFLFDRVKKISNTSAAPTAPQHKWTKEEEEELKLAEKEVAEIKINKTNFPELEKLNLDFPLVYCLADNADLASFLNLKKIKQLKLSREIEKSAHGKLLKEMQDFDFKESKYVEAFADKDIELF